GVSQKRTPILGASAVGLAVVAAAAAAVETATDIRRSLLPSILPPEQSATRPSSRRNVDRPAPGHRRIGGRDANRLILHGHLCAPFRKKCRAFRSRFLT